MEEKLAVGNQSPGALWPDLPGYKPEEPGMEGGGRDSGMFSPVLGSLYPVYYGLFCFVCRGRDIHVIGWSQKNPQASDTPTSKIFLTLLWRRSVSDGRRRLILRKAATIASYRVSHVLAKHMKSFKDGKVVKEAFLEAADALLADSKNNSSISTGFWYNKNSS